MHVRLGWLALLLLSSLSGTGCPGCDEEPGGGGPPPIVVNIGAEGGRIESADGRFALVVPEGALEDDVTLTLTVTSDAPAGAIGDAYEVAPSGTEFAVAARATLTLGDALGGNTLDDIVAATSEDDDDDWLELRGRAVDEGDGAISGDVDHLSFFAAVLDADALPPGPGPGPGPDGGPGVDVCGDDACTGDELCSNCAADCPCIDADGDGTFDDEDNCVGRANPGQADGDGDRAGDACDAAPFGSAPQANAPVAPRSTEAFARGYRLVGLSTDPVANVGGYGVEFPCSGFESCDRACGLAFDDAQVSAVVDDADGLYLGGAHSDGRLTLTRVSTNDTLEVTNEIEVAVLAEVAAGFPDVAIAATRVFLDDVLLVNAASAGGRSVAVLVRVELRANDADANGSLVAMLIGYDAVTLAREWTLFLTRDPLEFDTRNRHYESPVTEASVRLTTDGHVFALMPPLARRLESPDFQLPDDHFVTAFIPEAGTRVYASRRPLPVGDTFLPLTSSPGADDAFFFSVGFAPERFEVGTGAAQGLLFVEGVDTAEACSDRWGFRVMRVYDADGALIATLDIEADVAQDAAFFLDVDRSDPAAGSRVFASVVAEVPDAACVEGKRQYHLSPGDDGCEDPDLCTSCVQGELCRDDFEPPNIALLRYGFDVDGSAGAAALVDARATALGDRVSTAVAVDGRGRAAVNFGDATRSAIVTFADNRRVFVPFRPPVDVLDPSDTSTSFLFDEQGGFAVAGSLTSSEGLLMTGLVDENPLASETILAAWRAQPRPQLLPTAQGRLLALVHRSDGMTVRLLEPDTTFDPPGDMTFVPADVPAPTVDACIPGRGACAGVPLGLIALTRDPESGLEDDYPPGNGGLDNLGRPWVVGVDQFGRDRVWVKCTGDFAECPRDEMITQWQEAMETRPLTDVVSAESTCSASTSCAPGFNCVNGICFASPGGGAPLRGEAFPHIEIECNTSDIVSDSRAIETSPGLFITEHRLRCRSWEEVYTPGPANGRLGSVIDTVSVSNGSVEPPNELDPDACNVRGRAHAIRRIIVLAPPFEVAVEGPDGIDDTTIEEGQSVTITIPDDVDAAEVTVIEGSGTLDGDADGNVTVPGGAAVVLTGTAPGVILVEVTVINDDGREATLVLAILVEGAEPCGPVDAVDGPFTLCATLLREDLRPANELESRRSPAMVGDVLLHDLSLKVTAVDHRLAAGVDVALPIAVHRTYRGASTLTGDGILGGWVPFYDQRIVPFENNEVGSSVDACRSEPNDDDTPDHLAFFDEDGRVDVFRHPGTPAVPRSFGPGEADGFLVYDHNTQTLENVAFDADVQTYLRPRGRYEQLKAYTLTPGGGDTAADVHPYFVAGSGSVRASEHRFYELRAPSGERRIFNCRGQLIRIIDARFHEIELVYDGPSNAITAAPELTTIIDANGRGWDVDHALAGGDGRRRVTAITDPFGRRLEYSYTRSGDHVRLSRVTRRLTHATDAALSVTETLSYGYDSDGRLTRAIGADGRLLLDVDYAEAAGAAAADAAAHTVVREVRRGRAVRGDDPLPGVSDGEVVRYARGAGAAADEVSVTLPRGDVRRYLLAPLANDGARVIREEVVNAAVAVGDPRAMTDIDVDLTTVFAHDADGNVLDTLYHSGRGLARTYNTQGTLTAQTERPPITSELPERTETWDIEPACQMITRHVSYGGRETSYVIGDGDTGAPGGEPAALDEPGAFCSILTTNHGTVPGVGGVIADWHEERVLHADGPLRGLVERAIINNGPSLVRETVFVRDETISGGATDARVRSYPRGGVVTSETVQGPVPAECTLPVAAARTETRALDARGNTTQTTIASAAGNRVVAFVLDGKDRVIERREDPAGADVATRFEYDGADRVLVERHDVSDVPVSGVGPSAALAPSESGEEALERIYDALGHPRGFIRSATGRAGLDVEALGHDAAGDLAESLVPGPSMADADRAAFASRMRGDASFSELLASVAASRPTTEFGAGFIHTERIIDATGVVLSERIDDGEQNSASDPLLHVVTRRTTYDTERNRVAHDAGRTDRAGVRVLETRDGYRRLTSTRTVDSACSGDDALAEHRIESYDNDDLPGVRIALGPYGHGDSFFEPGLVCGPLQQLHREDLTYDALRGLASRTELGAPLLDDPDGNGLDGLADTHTAKTRTTTYVADDLGRSLEVRRFAGSTANGENALARSFYAAHGDACAALESIAPTPATAGLVAQRNLVSLDASGLPIVERRVSVGAPGGDITVSATRTFDRRGHLVRHVDGGGLVWEYVRDGIGRPRITKEPRGLLPYQGGAEGVFRVQRYDGAGNRIESRLVATDAPADERTATSEYRGRWLVGDAYGDAGGPRDIHAFALDVLGNEARTFPFGRASLSAVVLRAHNEAGEEIKRTELSGVVHTTTRDGLGRAITVSAVLPSGAAQPGYEGAVSLTRVMRWDGLSNMVWAQDGAGAAARTTRWYRDGFGNVLEEASDVDGATTVVRAVYDAFDHRVSLAWEGARDQPDLRYSVDALGRTARIESTSAAPELAELIDINYDYAGHRVVRRDLNVVGHTISTLTSYDERGEKRAVDHHLDGVNGDVTRVLASRRYMFGLDEVAASTANVTAAGPQTDVTAHIAPLLNAGSETFVDREPESFASSTGVWTNYAGHAWQGSGRLTTRTSLGDVERTENLQTASFSGRPSIELSYKTRAPGSYRIASEEIVSWLGDAGDEVISSGDVTQWRRVTYSYANAGAGAQRDRLVSVQHELDDSIDVKDLTQYPLTSASIASSHAYNLQHTASGLERSYGRFNPDPTSPDFLLLSDKLRYDAFERLRAIEDNQTDNVVSADFNIPSERGRTQSFIYDALDRRVLESYDVDSVISGERRRRHAYFGTESLFEETTLQGGGTVRDHYIFGPELSLPFAGMNYGGHVLLEDVDGRFAGFYAVRGTFEKAALQAASGSESAYKPQPYLERASILEPQFSVGVLASFTNWMFFTTTPDTRQSFRRVAGSDESLPMIDGLSMAAGGMVRLDHSVHPELQIELITLNPLFTTNTKVIMAVQLTIAAATTVFPALWPLAAAVLVYDVVSFVVATVQIARDVEFNGFTLNSAVQIAMTGISALGFGSSASSIQSKIARAGQQRSVARARQSIANRVAAQSALRIERARAMERLLRAADDEGQRIAHNLDDVLLTQFRGTAKGVAEIEDALGRAFNDAREADVGFIGRDNVLNVATGKNVPNLPFHKACSDLADVIVHDVAPGASPVARGARVSSINTFLDTQIASQWSPHANLAWIDGLAHGRVPVVVFDDLPTVFSPRPHGISFTEREFTRLLWKGYTYHPTPTGSIYGRGIMLPPP